MGKNSFSGGGTLLNNEAGFTSYDPADEKRRAYKSSEPVHTPIRAAPVYQLQVQEQLRILFGHIARGKKNPYVPMIFKDEIESFSSLMEWAQSKPEYEVFLQEQNAWPPKEETKPPTAKRSAKRKKVARMDAPKVSKKSITSKKDAHDEYSIEEQLEKLEVLMSELLEERRKPWYSETKKQAITERYHGAKKKHSALYQKAKS